MSTVADTSESARMLGGEKMFAHADRLAEWQAGRLPYPVTVEVDLTNSCNHHCGGCSFSYIVNIKKDSIPFDLAQRIIAELGSLGVKALTFSGGGEPLVYGPERVLTLMEQAVSLGMDVGLITNGSQLRSTRFLGLCKWVRVSLDGYDADTFARYHGRNDKEFAKVCDNFRALCLAAGKCKAAGLPCATVGAGYLSDRQSVERRDFWNMAEFCQQFDGLDYLQFRPLVINMVDDPTLTGGGWDSFTEEDLAATFAAYEEAKHTWATPTYRVLISDGKYRALSQLGFGKTYNRCLAHFLEAVVAADCRIYICCHGQGTDAFCLGDLRKNTFAEIWHSERAREVYESINPIKHCGPACRLHLQNSMLQDLSNTTHPNFI